MIKITHLYKNLNHQPVLKDINLTIQDGQILVVLGQSGVGKSVLLQHMIGVFEPDQGGIEIDGVSLKGLSSRQWLQLRRTMGYLFQEGALYDFMSVAENIAFPLQEHTSFSEQEIDGKIQQVLKLVGLQGVENQYPSQLSGGMRKRVALARAVILHSKFLFCDEPTSGLDPILSREITNLIKDISRHFQTTTVIASHDIQNAFRIADVIAVLKDGRIVAQGTPQVIQESQDQFIRNFIG